MKAIAKYPNHGAGVQTCDVIDYLLQPVKNNPDCRDRVAWLGGDLDGYGTVSRKASLMAAALDCGHEHLPGRRYWHVILSCETCADQESRDEAVRRLEETAPLMAALHRAKRWVAMIHRDTDHIHMHLIFANFDEVAYCRFTYNKSFLSKLQSMTWTPYLESGKGHRTGVRGVRGEWIARSVRQRRKEDPGKRNAALNKLKSHCAKHMLLKRSASALAKELDALGVPTSWDGAQLMTKKRKPAQMPTVTIDGIVIGLAFYLRWLRGMETRQKQMSPAPPKRPKLRIKPDLPSL